jgi:putative membrane protein
MSKIITFIKGMIIGFGKIIPGVSGSMFAMLFGVYEDIISIFVNPRNIVKKIDTIGPLLIGIIFSIILGSSLIKILLENFYGEAMFFFMGMMSFGVIPLIKEIRCSKTTIKEVILSSTILVILCLFFFIDIDSAVVNTNNWFYMGISLILCGILDAGSSIIPGISGTALLMLLGYYNTIISAFASPFSLYSLYILFFFLIGLVVGLYAFSKIISILFKRYEKGTKMCIIGFALFSIIELFISTLSSITGYNIFKLSISFILGFISSLLLGNGFKS